MVGRVVAVGLVAFLALAAGGRAQDEKTPKDPLPRADAVEWDVLTFEESPAFIAVKREVKNGEVVWVLENRKDLNLDHIFGYRAEFLDADGVKLYSVGFRSEPFPTNLRVGERNRFILELPRPEKWKGVKKVAVVRAG